MFAARRYSITPFAKTSGGVLQGALTHVLIPRTDETEQGAEKQGAEKQGAGKEGGGCSNGVTGGHHECAHECAQECAALRSSLQEMRETLTRMSEDLARVKRKSVLCKESCDDDRVPANDFTTLSKSTPSLVTKRAFLRVGKALNDTFTRSRQADSNVSLAHSRDQVDRVMQRRRSNTI